MRGALIAGLTLSLAACAATPGPTSALHAPPQNRTNPAVRNPRMTIVESATAMLGQPYRYGGAAPGGFDCSGLVMYAANSAGIAMPRTAREQLHSGSPVARSELKAGDLVFMHLTRKELHVGIAIDAGRFVHAPAAGRRVQIDSLDSPPYAGGFLAARRIVGGA